MDWLKVDHLGFRYAGEKTNALEDVSFSLRKGDLAVLCGPTGCGKSTLLRLLKRELAPRGDRSGTVLFRGRPQEGLPEREAAAAIGFVAQQPDQQIVTDRVWHELAFGLENLGTPPEEMRRRVAETAAFFGIEDLFDRRTDELSGGQKQLLNLAAVTAMRPELLILDEPAAHLDPIAAVNLMDAVRRLNRETGMTVLMAEHRLEDALPGADLLLIMENGSLREAGDPRVICGELRPESGLWASMPAAVRLYRSVSAGGICPLSVGEGRKWLEERTGPGTDEAPVPEKRSAGGDAQGAQSALTLREVSFRFERRGPDVLRSASLEVRRGEIFCLMGGNGSGKTTVLRAAAGLIRPDSGEIRLFGKKLRGERDVLGYHGATMLPQDPQTLFLRASVREELRDAGLGDRTGREDFFDFSALMDRHPYDLSGGEQRMLALTRVLSARPALLLLDEPTGGLDAAWRKRLTGVLRSLKEAGMTVLLVTHDPEFAAETADRCALLFRGSILAPEDPRAFFAGNSYYTTAVSRMTRGLLPGCVTAEEAAERLRAREGAEGRRGNR